MSLRAAAVARLRARVDSTLDEMFPAVLVIEGQEVSCSGPGGGTYTTFVDGGEAEEFKFSFRIDRDKVPTGWEPVMGGSIGWKVSSTVTLPLEISRTAVRPWDARFQIQARKRRV